MLPKTFGLPKPFSTVRKEICRNVPTDRRVATRRSPRNGRARRSKHPKIFKTKNNPGTLSRSCRRFIVTGRVQGVYFRASTRDVALDLSLTGYVRNLADGSVEVLACGRSDAIDALAAWLQEGPRMAVVSNVDDETLPYQDIEGFRTA
jgi:acylphosphatase